MFLRAIFHLKLPTIWRLNHVTWLSRNEMERWRLWTWPPCAREYDAIGAFMTSVKENFYLVPAKTIPNRRKRKVLVKVLRIPVMIQRQQCVACNLMVSTCTSFCSESFIVWPNVSLISHWGTTVTVFPISNLLMFIPTCYTEIWYQLILKR